MLTMMYDSMQRWRWELSRPEIPVVSDCLPALLFIHLRSHHSKQTAFMGRATLSRHEGLKLLNFSPPAVDSRFVKQHSAWDISDSIRQNFAIVARTPRSSQLYEVQPFTARRHLQEGLFVICCRVLSSGSGDHGGRPLHSVDFYRIGCFCCCCCCCCCYDGDE